MKSAVAFATVLVASAALAHAVVIQPDTASASSMHNAAYDPIHTIDGSGLLGDLQDLPDHAGYTSASNHWTASSGQLTDAWIKWGFNNVQTLDTIYLWNHQSDGVASNSGYDVGLFALTFLDASNSVIGTFNGTLAFDSPSAQAFTFGEISGIKHVLLDINSVQSSDNYTGLAEVAFELKGTTTVPDAAATGSLLGMTLGALGLAAGRRRFV